MKKAEREAILIKRLAEMKRYENELYASGIKYIAGVDEVGRGPLAGPVVAAAVVLPKDFNVPGVNDSKKLSPTKRDEFFDIIKNEAISYGTGQIEHNVIDEINILEATKQAMIKAIISANDMLHSKKLPDIQHILFDAVEISGVETPQSAIIKGDSKSISIAAASIIAKVTRDRQMIAYHEKYPYYSFDSNKGYGTKAHYKGLRAHGICPIHRRTFLKKLF